MDRGGLLNHVQSAGQQVEPQQHGPSGPKPGSPRWAAGVGKQRRDVVAGDAEGEEGLEFAQEEVVWMADGRVGDPVHGEGSLVER